MKEDWSDVLTAIVAIVVALVLIAFSIQSQKKLQVDLNTFEGSVVKSIDLSHSSVIISFTDGREIKATATEGFGVKATMIEKSQ